MERKSSVKKRGSLTRIKKLPYELQDQIINSLPLETLIDMYTTSNIKPTKFEKITNKYKNSRIHDKTYNFNWLESIKDPKNRFIAFKYIISNTDGKTHINDYLNEYFIISKIISNIYDKENKLIFKWLKNDKKIYELHVPLIFAFLLLEKDSNGINWLGSFLQYGYGRMGQENSIEKYQKEIKKHKFL